MLVNNRRTITELRGDIALHGNARHIFDVILAYKTRMVSGAASDDEDLVDVVQKRVVPAKLLQNHRAFVLRNTRGKRRADGFRLLVDLLQHEMLETAFFRSFRIPVHFKDFFADGYARVIHDGDADLRHHRHLAVA